MSSHPGTLGLRCQKLFGSVSKAWSSLWASSEEADTESTAERWRIGGTWWVKIDGWMVG